MACRFFMPLVQFYHLYIAQIREMRLYLPPNRMVIVAQLVRAPVCGSGGRGFETHLSPFTKKPCSNAGLFFVVAYLYWLSEHPNA